MIDRPTRESCEGKRNMRVRFYGEMSVAKCGFIAFNGNRLSDLF
jgi:hypothetical protein